MGRLFWKIFLGFWLTLVLISAAVGLGVNLYNQARWAELDTLAAGPRAEFAVASVASALRHGGEQAVAALFDDWPRQRRTAVLVVDAQGKDLFGRTVPQTTLEQARDLIGSAQRAPGLRRAQAADGQEFLVFVPSAPRPPQKEHRHRSPRPLLPLWLGSALLASLLFSAGLAWYLARPVRHLRAASRLLADGDLAVRVGPRIGRRRDEIADLGRDFDHMADRVQSLVSAQQRLLHDVSHELRSPLARLQVAIGLLRQKPERLENALQRIERESGRLDDLVGQLLTLSRLEAGVQQEISELDLGELLQEIAADARFEAGGEERRLTLKLSGSLRLCGNREALRRALENLVRNAMRFTREGSTVEVHGGVTAGGDIRIGVCDAGPGVSADRLESLFEPFVRADEPEGRGGYGLGLAIARRAVEAHGGTIRASNRDTGGLCLVIELPGEGKAHARRAS